MGLGCCDCVGSGSAAPHAVVEPLEDLPVGQVDAKSIGDVGVDGRGVDGRGADRVTHRSTVRASQEHVLGEILGDRSISDRDVTFPIS